LLKQRAKEVENQPTGVQAVFAMRLGLYRNAFEGFYPIDLCVEDWSRPENDTEKQIHECLKNICDSIKQPEPKPLGRIGCVTCGSTPLDAKLRGEI
jgi:hypothetical protein